MIDECFNGARLSLYNPEPDFTRPLQSIPDDVRARLLACLEALYGQTKARACLPELERAIKVHVAFKSPSLIERNLAHDPAERFTQADMILITYGDLMKNHGDSTLRTLAELARENLEAISTIHILPLFPSSSDRGFAIKDFRTVDPQLGSWEDIEDLKATIQCFK